jgi:large subunit ribosomal protein L4
MKVSLYNLEGKTAGTTELSDAVFGAPVKQRVVHEVFTQQMNNQRESIASTKTRGDVRGGGKKPWRQKGTGRARHGSTRSPIWVGGGVAHGPRNEKNYSRKINRKMRNKALYAILSRKLKDNEILFVDSLSFAEPKTKDALATVKSLGGIKGFEKLATKKNNTAFIALPSKDKTVEKSFNNFGNIEVGEARNLNPIIALNYKYLVIANPEETFKTLAK